MPVSATSHPHSPSAAPEPALVGSGALIGATMRIQGDVYSREDLVVNGEVVGTLEAENRLTVGSTGSADATVKGSEVIIAGTVKGNVEAKQRIVLRKGANLVGDVKTAGIVIEDGAYFRGGIDITRPQNAAAAAGGSR
jgi:cytoskeletal protein CcmA (bactofilin family)